MLNLLFSLCYSNLILPYQVLLNSNHTVTEQYGLSFHLPESSFKEYWCQISLSVVSLTEFHPGQNTGAHDMLETNG